MPVVFSARIPVLRYARAMICMNKNQSSRHPKTYSLMPFQAPTITSEVNKSTGIFIDVWRIGSELSAPSAGRLSLRCVKIKTR